MAKRFESALDAEEVRFGLSPKHLSEVYPWHMLPPSSLVVDIGGSTGKISLEIASVLSDKFKFIVEDRQEVISSMKNTVGSTDMESRVEAPVEFMAHDFFTPQPVKCADVYLLRLILHNWTENDCSEILRNLVPALKHGSRILLNEIVMPDWRDMDCRKSESDIRYDFIPVFSGRASQSTMLTNGTQADGYIYVDAVQLSRARSQQLAKSFHESRSEVSFQ